jgi:peroxiredoxin Q/BCP
MPLLEPGTKAPSFFLLDSHEKLVSLANFRSKYVVIYFYPRALTPGCTVQACSVRDNFAKLAHFDIQVLGISADSPKNLKKFFDKERLNFTLLSDPTHSTCDQYGVWQQKSMYGKSHIGIARVSYILDEQHIIRHVLPKVNPETHTEEIFSWVSEHNSR